MADLYSQYISGQQLLAGAITGSALGASGLNPIVDRLNSISDADGAYSNLSAGEGIDISNGSVIAGEDASTTNKGVASFNSADFSVSAGAVSIQSTINNNISGTSTTIYASGGHVGGYWSAPGVAFQPMSSSTITQGGLIDEGDASTYYLPVYIPHGATVTAVRVTGAQNSATTWTLYRKSSASAGDSMASAQIGQEDTSISNATVDNSAYAYYMSVALMDGRIDWVRITYI